MSGARMRILNRRTLTIHMSRGGRVYGVLYQATIDDLLLILLTRQEGEGVYVERKGE